MGKGSSTPQAPKINIPPQLTENIGMAQDVGTFASSLWSPLESMANWAGNLATGGNVQGLQPWQSPSGKIFSASPGSYSPFVAGGAGGGGGVAGVPGAGGTPGVQAAQAGPVTLSQSMMDSLKAQGVNGFIDPGSGKLRLLQVGDQVPRNAKLSGNALTPGGQFFQGSLQDFFGNQLGGGQQALGGGPAATGIGPVGQTLGLTPWSGGAGGAGVQGAGNIPGGVSGSDISQAQLLSGQPMSWDWVAHDAGLQSSDIAAFIRQGKTPQEVAVQFGVARAPNQAQNVGPFMSSAISALNQEAGIAGTTPTGLDPATLLALQQRFFGLSATDAAKTAEQMPGGVVSQTPGGNLPSSGLYPQQQAMIDAQTKAAQAAITQQLASEGLSGSTQGAELRGEIGQQGAAEAGKLIQGNIGLAQQAVSLGQQAQGLAAQWQQVGQNWAKLGAGEQTLSLAQQEQSFNMFAQVSNQSQQMQNQMWTEAMQGYGMLGNFVSSVLSAFDLSTKGAADVLSANIDQSAIQAKLDEASMTQQSSGASSMFSSLGSLFGGGGGSGGGGLLGGLGGLFGGAGAGAATGIGIGAASGAAAAGGTAVADVAGLAFTAV